MREKSEKEKAAFEARYRKFNSIQKIVVKGILGPEEKLMHRGRVVSEAYVRRLAKKELYDMRVAQRKKDGLNR